MSPVVQRTRSTLFSQYKDFQIVVSLFSMLQVDTTNKWRQCAVKTSVQAMQILFELPTTTVCFNTTIFAEWICWIWLVYELNISNHEWKDWQIMGVSFKILIVGCLWIFVDCPVTCIGKWDWWIFIILCKSFSNAMLFPQQSLQRTHTNYASQK